MQIKEEILADRQKQSANWRNYINDVNECLGDWWVMPHPAAIITATVWLIPWQLEFYANVSYFARIKFSGANKESYNSSLPKQTI